MLWTRVLLAEQKALLEKLQQQEKDKITKFRVEVSSASSFHVYRPTALHLSVCRLTDTVIGYEHAAFLHGGWKT